jgi:hypothetical protein
MSDAVEMNLMFSPARSLYPPHSFAAEKMRIVPDFLKSSILAPGW